MGMARPVRLGRAALCAALVYLLSASAASALPVVFTDRAAWNAALVGGTPDSLVDFEGFSSDVPFGVSALDLGPFTASCVGTTCSNAFRVDAPPVIGGVGIDFTGSHLRADAVIFNAGTANRHLLLTYDTPFSAWGADYSGAGGDNLADGNRGVDIEFTTSAGTQTITIPTDDGFIGFIDAAESITEIAFLWHSGNQNEVYGLDDVSAGTPIPEPTTSLLLSLGLAALSLRRRQQADATVGRRGRTMGRSRRAGRHRAVAWPDAARAARHAASVDWCSTSCMPR